MMFFGKGLSGSCLLALAGLGGFLAVSVFAPASAEGGGITSKTGFPTLYSIKIHEFALCDDLACTNRVTLASTGKRFDLASVGAGDSAGSMGAGDDLVITTGTYPYVLLSVDSNIGTHGRVSFPDQNVDCITDAGAGLTDDGDRLGKVVTTGEGTTGDSYEELTEPAGGINTADYKVTYGTDRFTLVTKLSDAITISSVDSLPDIRVNFDVGSALYASLGNYQDNLVDAWCTIGSDAPNISIKVGELASTVQIAEIQY